MTLTINTVDGRSYTTECTEDEYKDILIDCALSASVVIDQKLTKYKHMEGKADDTNN